MKKILFITSIMIVLSLCACSSNNTADNSSATPSTTGTGTADNNSSAAAGSNQAGTEAGNAATTSEEPTVTQDPAILKFAEQLNTYITDKDLESFSKVCTYPLYINSIGSSVKDETELVALGADTVFSSDLVNEITETKNAVIQDYSGYRIGGGTFNIWFDSSCKVTGINN